MNFIFNLISEEKIWDFSEVQSVGNAMKLSFAFYDHSNYLKKNSKWPPLGSNIAL